ncbi:MAG: acyl-CoA dehydrogenase family protein, partial [Pseudomonadota bacterium]
MRGGAAVIDLAPTDEQRQILDSVDRFAARHLPPDEQQRRDAAHDPPYHLLPVMAEMGLLALPFPARYGGLDGDWRTVALVQERLGYRAWMAGSLMNRALGFGGMSLMTYGTEKQRERLIPEIIAGRALFALALTEPEAGSDAAAIATRAERTGDGWRLTGRKTWCSDADRANFLVIVARSAPGSERREGLSMFLVPRDTAGLHMTELPKVGNNCLPSFDIGLDGVEVGAEALMGEEGAGFRHLGQTLRYSRSGLSAAAVGAARRRPGAGLRQGTRAVRPADRPVSGDRPPAGRHADARRPGQDEPSPSRLADRHRSRCRPPRRPGQGDRDRMPAIRHR